MDLGLPEELARGSCIAQNELGLLLMVGSRQEHAVAYHRGRTVTTAGDRDLPQHVLGGTPFQRRPLLWVGDTIAGRATPPGPVGRGNLDRLRSAWRRLLPGKRTCQDRDRQQCGR